jgi:hypothetical protein
MMRMQISPTVHNLPTLPAVLVHMLPCPTLLFIVVPQLALHFHGPHDIWKLVTKREIHDHWYPVKFLSCVGPFVRICYQAIDPRAHNGLD